MTLLLLLLTFSVEMSIPVCSVSVLIRSFVLLLLQAVDGCVAVCNCNNADTTVGELMFASSL